MTTEENDEPRVKFERPLELVINRQYLARQAETLLKLAKSINNPDLAGALIEMASDLKKRLDETGPPPDVSPRAPDIQTGT